MFILCGIPGFIIGILLFFTVKEPKAVPLSINPQQQEEQRAQAEQQQQQATNVPVESNFSKRPWLVRSFIRFVNPI